MEDLIRAIRTTPIIDNHAHPLLTSAAQKQYPLLAITTEAHGDAMKATPSSLSHIRAVTQLSKILGCPTSWEAVVQSIEVQRLKPDNTWAKRCLEGVETILVDDGLDGKEDVFDYSWHNQLTRNNCKRIVRIEKVAEEIIEHLLNKHTVTLGVAFQIFKNHFVNSIKEAIADPEVVGFKSVICYRTGLDISDCPEEEFILEFKSLFSDLKAQSATEFKRIDRQFINSSLVNLTAELIQAAPGHKKPLQFHTGLGDNDITLSRSSPSHLQPFIRKYPNVPIVLLHASYPWTKEAGYLASVYDNVYADIGEVFPMVSKDGQERLVREILELCPTEKVLWSTDGHWFPETYLLAVIQVREVLEVVLSDYVRKNILSVPQAVKAVEHILFRTSNDLYDLGLPLKPLPLKLLPPSQPKTSDFQLLTAFLEEYPDTKFLRLQYLDYTATPRLRVIPIRRALAVLQSHDHLSIGITKASLGILQNDTMVPGVTATGEYKLQAVLSSIRPGPCKDYASVQGEFCEYDGSGAELCPRSKLRSVLENSKSRGLEFLIGFEIEVVFLSRITPESSYTKLSDSDGHAWSSARALRGAKILDMLNEIYDSLCDAGIYLEQWHPESATGQYEFVLPSLPPLPAVDSLLHAREIINTVAAKHSLRATLHPKPFENQAGTASHVHISISSPNGNAPETFEPFYAGILAHLPAIVAFTYSNPASYDRIVDGYWAGGSWVSWGTQNRETVLRKISGSHWEVKCLDGLANIYLAMAALLAAGTQGVVKREQLAWVDCEKDPADLEYEEREKLGVHTMLPRNLDDALAELESDEEFIGILGRRLVGRYQAVKLAEMKLLSDIDVSKRWGWIVERY
ncbi:Uncharacterized protein BP5553_09882 [Venustampulla echinocandica]|uniref:GS catalytic domain-containing protein n=1 Tax=Venustampulla echinocandica TaxID=2656787 RepID=A0A370TAY0_9HELO|nr:Uncharacterized protein BP5553_09882 [Venustampulla echinocandica]RDL31093.1 Uncharacterized protein BP5553_09882 [Venustampulla echinocandica]